MFQTFIPLLGLISALVLVDKGGVWVNTHLWRLTCDLLVNHTAVDPTRSSSLFNAPHVKSSEVGRSHQEVNFREGRYGWGGFETFTQSLSLNAPPLHSLIFLPLPQLAAKITARN